MKEENELHSKYLEHRLKIWADWQSKKEGDAHGYSTESLTYKIMTVGALSKASGPRCLPSNPEAEEVEGWLKDLSKIYPSQAQALREKYLYTNPYLSEGKRDERVARKLDMSASLFRYRVNNAKMYLLGCLEVKIQAHQKRKREINFIPRLLTA